MKSMTFEAQAGQLPIATGQTATVPLSARIANGAQSFVASIRAEMADRRMRRELSNLDSHLLRDIGIETDEMPRVYSRERFVPRAWR